MSTKPLQPTDLAYLSRLGYFQVDVAKRRSRCRICNLSIIKGDTRVGLGFLMGRWVAVGSGGYSRVTHYFHASCVQDAIANVGQTHRRCVCGLPAKVEIQEHDGIKTEKVMLWGVNGAQAHALCEQCLADRYIPCDVCNLNHLKCNINKIPGVAKWGKAVGNICDNCAYTSDIVTPKRAKKQEMYELKIEAELAQIRRLIRDDNVLNTN